MELNPFDFIHIGLIVGLLFGMWIGYYLGLIKAGERKR